MKYLVSFVYIVLILTLSNSFSQAQTSTSVETPASSPKPEPSAASSTVAIVKPEDPPPALSRYVRKDSAAPIPRFQTVPVIDGQLNDAIWQDAAAFGDFLQIQPGDNLPPSSPVEVLMGYDAKNLYIAFRVKQDRGKVRASIARRDNIFDDDYVGLYLDTFNDQRQAYALFFNPLGIQADGTFSEQDGEDYSVDLVMESKGVLTEDGYTIEIAVPFKSLRYEAGKSKQWGMHLYRRAKYNNNELDSWMPGNRNASGSLNKAGHITGLEGIATTRQLEISPSITLSESGRRTRHTFNNDPSGRYVNDGLKTDIGLTAKFSFTPTITLDFAYNPDFAQVEADAPVTSANQRFPIFYSEKRPFFLERIDMFKSPMSLVNTRSIVDPDIAAKLTGRSGKNTFGILYASDKAPGNYSPDEREDLRVCKLAQANDPTIVCSLERVLDKNADIGVLRLKRDVGKESNIGFFATTYNFVNNHNHTAGFDGRIRFDPKTVFEFQVVGTNSRRTFYDPDQDRNIFRTGNGLGYSAWLERSGRNLYMNFLATGNSRDYRANVGFTQRTDSNYLGSFIQYQTERDAKKKIIFKRIQNSSNIRYNFRGQNQYSTSNTQGMLGLQRQTFVGVGYQWAYERVFEREFGANRTATRQGAFTGDSSERHAYQKDFYGFIESTPIKQIYINFVTDYTFGQMDFDLGHGGPYNPGAGNQLTLDATVRFQPTTALQTQLNFTKLRMVRQDTGLVAFDDNIISSRSTYQFSRYTFARLRLDYSSLDERFRPQFVVGWTPNPGTAFYVGYSDDLNYKGRNPFTGGVEPGIQKNGRTFFIKASYLFKKSF